jgi:amino acid transporter
LQVYFLLLLLIYIEVLGCSKTGVSISQTEEPLSFLSQQAGVGLLGELVGLGALFSFFACILGSINPATRVAFLMTRHGLFHGSFGNAHAADRTPHVAVTMCLLLTFIIPAVMSFFQIKLFDCMGYLGSVCSYGFLTVYILISVIAPVYLYKIRKLRPIDVMFSVLAVGFMMI